MSKFMTKLKEASPAILTCFGIAGVIGTAVMAVKETPKALRLIKAKKDELETDTLTPAETVEAVWQCYVPSALMGAGTILCITGIGITSRHNQASLASAYAMIRESYSRYRQAAKRVYGEDADERIHAEAAKDAMVADGTWGYRIYDMGMDPESEQLLFYDSTTNRYFNTTMAAVLNAQYHINRNLALRGYCCLNEYLSFLGLEEIQDGNEIGWDAEDLLESMGSDWLDFDNHKTILDDGLECVVISTVHPIPHGAW